MIGLLSGPEGAKKKKRVHEEGEPNIIKEDKRVRKEVCDNGKLALHFENSFPIPTQEALTKFREASAHELTRLRSEGMDPSDAINKLVEKMRTTEDDEDDKIPFTRQEVQMVMEIADTNEEGATRVLILKSELSKLRQDGFTHPEAINELSRRMRRLAGTKRRGLSPSDTERVDDKHRRKDSFSSRVSFTMAPLRSLETPLRSLALPSINRKRLQDALMLDDEQFDIITKRHKFERDLSESEESSGEEHHHFEDVGEFSQDEKEFRLEEGDSDDLHSSEDIMPFTNFSPSSSEEDMYHKGDEEGHIHDWLGPPGLIFHPVEGEGEEGEGEDESDYDDTWHTIPISSSSRTSATTTTTTSSTSTTTHTENPLITTLTTPLPFTATTTTTFLPRFSLPPTRAPSLRSLPRAPKRRDATSTTTSMTTTTFSRGEIS